MRIKEVYRHKMMNNGMAVVVINGQCFEVIKQGMLGFWAGYFRDVKYKLTRAEMDEIDKALDAALANFDNKRRSI